MPSRTSLETQLTSVFRFLDDAVCIMLGDYYLDPGGGLRMSAGSFKRQLKRLSTRLAGHLKAMDGYLWHFRSETPAGIETLGVLAENIALVSRQFERTYSSIPDTDERTLVQAYPEAGQMLREVVDSSRRARGELGGSYREILGII